MTPRAGDNPGCQRASGADRAPQNVATIQGGSGHQGPTVHHNTSLQSRVAAGIRGRPCTTIRRYNPGWQRASGADRAPQYVATIQGGSGHQGPTVHYKTSLQSRVAAGIRGRPCATIRRYNPGWQRASGADRALQEVAIGIMLYLIETRFPVFRHSYMFLCSDLLSMSWSV